MQNVTDTIKRERSKCYKFCHLSESEFVNEKPSNTCYFDRKSSENSYLLPYKQKSSHSSHDRKSFVKVTEPTIVRYNNNTCKGSS